MSLVARLKHTSLPVAPLMAPASIAESTRTALPGLYATHMKSAPRPPASSTALSAPPLGGEKSQMTTSPSPRTAHLSVTFIAPLPRYAFLYRETIISYT